METLKKLESLKSHLESLWAAIESAPASAQGRLRSEYAQAYQSYKRQLTWVEEVTLRNVA